MMTTVETEVAVHEMRMMIAEAVMKIAVEA